MNDSTADTSRPLRRTVYGSALIGSNPSDVGLLYGLCIAQGKVEEVELSDLDDALARSQGVCWLHFNLSNARAREFLAHAMFVPDEVREVFRDHDVRRRVELIGPGILAVISDLTFEPDSDPAEVAPLWCYVSDQLFITARMHPLKTTDQLRAAVRSGFKVDHGIELLAWIIGRRTLTLSQLATEMSEQVSEIEDEILSGRVKEQREQLGRIRRFCARMRRHFAPDRAAFLKLLQRTNALSESQAQLIRSEIDELSFLIDEGSELYERSKLLQEELASRVAEDTGRSLYVLAILSAVFLPMTLISGIFGMNVAGMPGMHSKASFWIVTLLIVGAGVATLATIFSRRP
jgi:zinc transporter